MAGEDEKLELDDEDGPDAEFKAVMRKAIAEATPADDDDDAGGFDAPLEEVQTSPTDSQDEGLDIATKARFRNAEGKFAKAIDDGTDAPDGDKGKAEGAEVETKPGDKPAAADDGKEKPAAAGDTKADAKPGDKPEGEGDKPADAPADLSKASVADLRTGMDAAKPAEITKRIAASSEVMDLFKGKEEALKMHGLDRPHEAIKRLLYLNEFAQNKPDEYIAWVAGQVKPNEAHSVLEAAAKRFGYKVVKDAPEDDEFEDEETKRLREENATLRAKTEAPWGPDAPQYQQNQRVADTLTGFVNERDETGNLKRPYWEILKGRVTELASAQFQGGAGKAVTTDDLQRFYDQASNEARGLVGGNDTSAAQPAPAMQYQPQTQAAPAPAQKPADKAASKMIDGDGPGATRRPALPETADLRATLRHFTENG